MKDTKVLLMARYSRLGASSRLRSYQYLPYLKQNGIDIKVAPLLGDDYINDLYSGKGRRKTVVFHAYLQRIKDFLGVRHFNLIWIEKELFPFFPAWGEALLDFVGIPYIVDYDDAIFHNYDLHSNKLVRFCLRNKIDQVMKRAAIVVVGNDYLGDRARQAGAKRVEYIPTVVDLKHYKMVPKQNEAPFTIGWIGSPATAKYIKLIQTALSEVCENGKARVVLVGSGPVGLNDVPVEILPWTEESEAASIQNFDVGIMPLPYEPWELGKCGYKLIQYMACGKPVVASPVGANRQIVEHGINGFLADDIADWVAALKELRDNVSLRKIMGYAGRRKVEEQYCLQVTAPRLAEILRSVFR
jgi:glycosyltransferase involved in cell wall biosynthesis